MVRQAGGRPLNNAPVPPKLKPGTQIGIEGGWSSEAFGCFLTHRPTSGSSKPGLKQ